MVLLCTGAGILLLFLIFLVFGSGCYLLSQGVGLLGAYSNGIPVDKALSQNNLSDAERLMLEESLAIREFAQETLGLKTTKNYSVFVRIDKDYLADVVNACDPYSFTTYYWDYPFMGKLPYKGYFARKDAEAEARRLAKKGYDVLVRKVDAFSTLGFFTDPLFSFMSTYSATELADLIIHESTHATVFLKGQAEFNENLASFVGEKGGLLYAEVRFGKDSAEYKAAVDGLTDMETYRRLLTELITRLELVYGQPEDAERKDKKRKVIDDFLADYETHYDENFLTQDYRGLSSLKIDNAYLSLFLNYNSQMPQWNSLFERSGKTLPAFIDLLKRIPKDAPDPWLWLEQEVAKEAAGE